MYAGLLYIVYSGNKRYYTKLYGSYRFRDSLNRSTCKIEKTRTDQAGSKLTEPNSGFFFFFSKSDEATVSSASMVVTALECVTSIVRKSPNLLYMISYLKERWCILLSSYHNLESNTFQTCAKMYIITLKLYYVLRKISCPYLQFTLESIFMFFKH